ncbi:MAG: hypothetical protein Q9213_006430 [Squamulea squamosa]
MNEIEFSRGVQDESSVHDGIQHLSRASTGNRPSQKLQRPRHREIQWQEDLQHSTEQPTIKRQVSQGRLLGIFTRTKSTKAAKAATRHEKGNDQAYVGDGASSSVSTPWELFQDNSSGIKVASASPGETTKQQPLMTRRTKSFRKDPSDAKPIPWDPPPLFQAYPQAVKHTTIPAPAMSADAILRYQSDKRRRTKKRAGSREPRKSDSMHLEEDNSKDDNENGLQLGQWSPKVYLLVTSGYFLQYAGEGSFDRLPEKIMPIGKDSAAFASDAVPGKHWVMQVSHSSDENGNPKIENSWSFFKRLGMGGDLKRCSASNFLLVLENPKNLDAWLSAVRKEIESWGGKRYHDVATARSSDEEAALALQQTSSRRYKVMRDPNQFSKGVHETSATSGEAITDDVPSLPERKFSIATQNSVHCSPSTTNETASTDQNILDRLRSSPRMSYYSTGAKTQSTSRDSLPLPSPTKAVFQLSDFNFSHEPLALDDRTGTTSDQASTYNNSVKPLEHMSPMLSRPTSKGKSSRTSSTGAPNFSVPSFSKRYSNTYSTPPMSTTSSSSAVNLPRNKSMSPPAIDERYDAPQTLASSMPEIEGREVKTSRPKVADENDKAPSIAHDNRPPNLNPTGQLSTVNSTIPRRFSSLEYSRGISPSKSQPSPSVSPHPPPTTALPALPALPQSTNSMSSAPARKLRRPISMQVHTFPSSSTSTKSEPLPTIASPSSNEATFFLPPPSRPPPPPPPLNEPLSSHVPSTPSKVQNRRSMPHLSRSPYDPPDYPLPTPPVPKLPPIKLSSGSLRRSVERPLRAGLGPRAPGLVEGKEY